MTIFDKNIKINGSVFICKRFPKIDIVLTKWFASNKMNMGDKKMNKQAIYHQSHDQWQAVVDHRVVDIRIQTGKDIHSVTCIYGDPHEGVLKESGWTWKSHQNQMKILQETEFHYIWTTQITPPQYRLKYHFIIASEDEVVQFGEDGFTDMDHEVALWNNFFCPYVHESMAFKAPGWVKDTIWYQIFPERFYNGDQNNDPQGTLPWGQLPVSNHHFYGGDLKGITQKLDYLKDLGFSGIYLTPVFEAITSHKYDTTDYYRIDPAFGTKEDLIELVKQAHARGIRVMLDAVFNHSGSTFFAWEDVKNHKEKSAYAHWFHINSFEPLSYETFSYAKNMPKLNLSIPEVAQYFIDIATYWIKEANIDGWRLDVANEIDPQFWIDFRNQVKKINPDVYILGEVWHDSMKWLRGNMFDAVMNYPFGRSILDFLTHKIDGTQFKYRVNKSITHYPTPVNEVQFNLLDSHDTERLRYMMGQNLQKTLLALALLSISYGTISIYYGTEIAMDGAYDPDCRRCMDWNPSKESFRFKEHFKKLMHLRNNFSAMRNQSEWNWISTEGPLLIQRKNDQSSIYLLANPTDAPMTINVGKYLQQPLDAYSMAPHAIVVTLLPYQYVFLTQAA